MTIEAGLRVRVIPRLNINNRRALQMPKRRSAPKLFRGASEIDSAQRKQQLIVDFARRIRSANFSWNERTAVLVRGPATPSFGPGAKPLSLSRVCTL